MLLALIPIVSSIIGSLVSKAETKFPAAGAGPEKKAWVLEFFNDMEDILKSRSIGGPSFWGVWDTMKPMLSDLIEAQVETLKKVS